MENMNGQSKPKRCVRVRTRQLCELRILGQRLSKRRRGTKITGAEKDGE